MRKFLLASAAIVALASPVSAQQLSLGTGFNFGNVQTGAATATAGTAAAGSLAAGNNTSIGTGFAVQSPAGGVTAGVGASAGQSQSVSGAASIGNGAALTGGFANNIGAGVGIGFNN
jgi:hypothetical protein